MGNIFSTGINFNLQLFVFAALLEFGLIYDDPRLSLYE